MPPFHSDYLDLFRDGPPAPEDFERYLTSHDFPEVADRPGWFRGFADPRQFSPRLQERLANAGVHFTLFDPDKKELPYHRSAAFMVHPAEFRMDCLFRNPDCIQLSARLFEGARALASGQDSPGGLLEFKGLEHELFDRFGLSWTLPFDQDGNLLELPQPDLLPAFPAAPLYGGPTARGRRGFAKALAARRTHHGVKAPRNRTGDTTRRRMLAVWDLREGWTGSPATGYDTQRRLPLTEAMRRAGADDRDYYHAFRLVTGEEYSEQAWARIIGARHPKALALENALRRRTGRQRGAPRQPPRPQTLPAPPAPAPEIPDSDAIMRELEHRLKELAGLLVAGVPVEVALQRVPLSDNDMLAGVVRAHPEQLREWAARGAPSPSSTS
jgi:hypothetical protein